MGISRQRVIETPEGDVTIEVGESVHFTSSASDPDGPMALSYQWDFRGGAPNVVIEDPGNVRFDREGAFEVTLTVVDRLGLPDPTPARRLVIVRQADNYRLGIDLSGTQEMLYRGGVRSFVSILIGLPRCVS